MFFRLNKGICFILFDNSFIKNNKIFTVFTAQISHEIKKLPSILTFSCGLLKVVSQQSELCVFRCVASAAHFFTIVPNLRHCLF